MPIHKVRIAGVCSVKAGKSFRRPPALLVQAAWMGVTATLGVSAASLLFAGGAMAQRIPVTALPSGGTAQALVAGSGTIRMPQIVSGAFGNATTAAYGVSGNVGTITQTSNSGILRWATFDIGGNATVNVNMPGPTAVLLNKVDGGAYMNKTLIEGMLNSNGQVYIYNPNGIIFGRNSQINVNSLVATSLKIDDNRFLAGLVAPNTTAYFNAETALIPNPDPLKPGTFVAPGAVEVESAARITAATGGKILLVGPTVINNGNLSAPDGQVGLAAGGRVYLASPTDVKMRGLLIEVSNDNLTGTLGADADGRTASTVTNDVLAKIAVGQGNASLVGYAVNQRGIVSATTSVQVNGSIYLRARDGVGASKTDPNSAPVATRGGNLVLGENSVTQVLPTLDDSSTAAGNATFNASQVDLSGATIHLQQGARIVAPAGEVSVVAQLDPSRATAPGNPSVQGGRVYMETGSSIDVSGTTTTELAMESNVITVQLRGSELADVPLQRDSIVRGQNLNIDIRKGTPLGNVSGYLALVEQNVGQRTAAGGSVKFGSDGDVILKEGSSVNVSGGKVNFKDGYVATTQLTSGGSVFDIGAATPDRIYDGLATPVAGPRNFEKGYSDGGSAGSIFFNAPNLIMRGNLQGAATPGARQRDVTVAGYPIGGTIVIGKDTRLNSTELGNFTQFNYLGTIDIGGTSTVAAATPAFGDAWNAVDPAFKAKVDVNADALVAGGFAKINAYTQGNIFVSRETKLGAAGEVRLAAQNDISINAGIASTGGTIEAVSAESNIVVANGVGFDVAGMWTNDRGAGVARDAQGTATAAIARSGGTIALSGRAVTIGDNASLDVSGGAWQNGSGKISGGSGGSITIATSRTDSLTPLGTGTLTDETQLTLGSNVEFRGYGVLTGGSLKLGARNVVIGGAVADSRDLSLAADFFQHGGFSKFDISAAGNLTVASGATVSPLMQTWIANRTTTTKSDGRMRDVFDVGTLPLAGAAGARGASSLTLSAKSELLDGEGRLWLQSNTAIVTDPGATVKLSAGRQLTLDAGASIVDHGGSVNLLLTPAAGGAANYRAERSIWLGRDSLIDVSGSAERLWTDIRGITSGELLDGGKIFIGRFDTSGNVAPATGYVIAESGSRLDVSGTSAGMKLASRFGTSTETVASAGGAIDIRAREGLLLEGTFNGAGGNNSVAGGSVALTLDSGSVVPAGGYPAVTRNLTISRLKPNAGTPTEGIVPAGLAADQAIVGENGQGVVLADALNKGGFDRIGLKNQDVITFDTAGSTVGLNARASITVDAPLLKAAGATAGNSVNLSAANVQLGNSDWQYQAVAAANTAGGGNATLNVNARNIDIVGASVTQGFGHMAFNSSGDVRLIGQVNIDVTATPPAILPVIHAYGSFTTAGTLEFNAAQTYTTTLSEFTLNATGGNNINFNGTGVTPAAPYSAAATLQVNAANIVQNGVLRAPFGSIALNADDSLTFASGSLTSVAGSGTVPLGRINNGREWLYDFGNGNTIALNNSSASNGVNLPQKSIVSKAAHITVQNGATLDLAGGGELYGYEFTPGPGGSRDVLGKTTGTAFAATFAIIPGYSGEVAAQDYQYGQDGSIRLGDRIYLSGSPGVPAGYYTLLPAHYALLPGAYAVTAASGTRDMTASSNFAKPDGTWLVAGKFGSLDTLTSRSTGFIVASSAQVRTQSEFVDYSSDNFFAATTAARNQDGGHVAFAATQSLALQGQVNLGAAGAGTRGIADIAAPEITVVADAAQNTGTALKLLASDLVALGADSLLLGGLRNSQTDGDHITNVANTVTLANDAAHPLTGGEVILVAADTVKVNGGAAIASSGTPSRTQQNLVIDGSGANADGALLRVSGGSAVSIVRNAPFGNKGTLDIAAGAVIGATGSVNLDATLSLVNNGQLGLGNGTALGLGANRISLGNASPLVVEGLRFDDAAISQLNGLSNLALTSYKSIDIYGTVNLGGSATRTLTLTAGGIQNYGGSSDTTSLSAIDTVRFNGGGAFSPATPAPAAMGSFSATARDIQIGSGAFAIKGYTNATLTANREVRADGKAGVLSAEKNLTVQAGRITASSNADAAIQSGSNLVLMRVVTPMAPPTTLSLGGTLNFSGNTVQSDANVVVNAGQIGITGTQGVTVSGGKFDASGQTIAFGSTYAYAPGGRINLDGGSGSVQVDAPATLDVSAVGADAGTLNIKASNAGATGSINIAGTLKGDAAAGVDGKTPLQGSVTVDVDQLANGFGTLNQKLNAGGFSESRQFRARASDVMLASGESIVAHDVLISADNGNITVGGAIDASGAKGGSIQIFAGEAARTSGKGNVTLNNTAKLLATANTAAASAAGSNGDGGRVLIGTSSQDGLMMSSVSGNASISVDAPGATHATIDVSGAGAGQGGTVTFRSPRVDTSGSTTTAGSNVAISGLGNTTVTGSRETVVEAYKVYNGTTITAADGINGNLDARVSGTPNVTATTNNTQAFISGPLTFTASATSVAIATEIITMPTVHGFANGEQIIYSSGGGTAIGGLVSGNTYFIRNVTSTGFQLAATAGGAAINLTATGSGANQTFTSSNAGSSMYAQGSSFMGNQSAILLNLDSGGANNVKLRVGMEVRSSGDLTVNVNETQNNPYRTLTTPFDLRDRGWNLNAWRFGSDNQPGVLTLRAVNNLTIQGSISDGFTKPTGTTNKTAMPDWALDQSGGASWSYRMVGGSDMSAANPLAVIARSDAVNGNGNVKLTFQPAASTGPAARNFTTSDQPVALLRSGSGRIDVAAGNNVTLDKITGAGGAAFGAAVYTAGVHSTTANIVNNGVSGVVAPKATALNSSFGGSSSLTVGAEFASGGGAVTLYAANNVTGAGTDQLVNNWLFRRGRTNLDASGATVFATAGSTSTNAELQQTAWWSRYDYFNQGVATFGGGDISVTADRGNITDLAVSAATNGQVATTIDAVSGKPSNSLLGAALSERGGGDVSVRAGGDIRSGAYYVQKGHAALRAGAAVTTSARTVTTPDGVATAVRTVLALGDASVSMVANGDINIESTFNPTQTRQSSVNALANGSLISVNANSGLSSPTSANYGYFSTYGENSGVNLTSVSGNVVLGNNATVLTAASGTQISTPLAADNGDYQTAAMFRVFPGVLNAAALQGDLRYERGFTLAPSASGQLNLLAGGSVRSAFANGSGERVVMSDADPSSLPGVLSPRALSKAADVNRLTYEAFTDGLQFHTASTSTSNGLHGNDTQPVRIVALNGDVSGDVNAVQTFILPKRAEIIAGRDIKDFGFKIQNVNSSDVTLLQAGRDLVDTTSSLGTTAVSHQVSGPGRVEIEAARNVDLGNSTGLRTRGNLDNPYLPDSGAGINVVAGARADYANFMRFKYADASGNMVNLVTPGDLMAAADPAALIGYMRNLQPSLPATLSAAEALTAFNALPDAQRQAFINPRDPGGLIAYMRTLQPSLPSTLSYEDALAAFNALSAKDSGSFIAANKPLLNRVFFTKPSSVLPPIPDGADGRYSEAQLITFDAVIASLFPLTAINSGDINVFGSQIKTERGGEINLFTPGGSVYAGLAQQPAWLATKLKAEPGFAANLGITTVRSGELQSLVKNDFLVNQGRVFTLGGGDITLISQFHNIDAGRGTKTAVSAPPPLITTDSKGNTVVDISGSISGSGIATLQTNPNVPAANILSVTPRGFTDTGDGGIRSSGKVKFDGGVINPGNAIGALGVSSSKPAPPPAAPTAPPAAAPAAKAESAASTPPQTPTGAASLTVELIGTGPTTTTGDGGGTSQQNVTQDGQN